MNNKDLQQKSIDSNYQEDETNGTTCNFGKTNSQILSNLPFFSEIIKKQNKSSHQEFIWEEQFGNNLSVHMIDTNFESSSVSLHYGNFRVINSVLFANFPSDIFSSLKVLGYGSFGKVYEFQVCKSYYAIKIINIKNGIQKGYSRELYKQYFLNCLADQLGVGPKVIPLFGYDLIITEDAVIFCMQKCSPPKLDHKKSIQKQLQQNLSLMHSIGFVHLDIKPENIAFSEVLQKHVFIDFGLSSLIRQRVGQKSMTSFLGTLHYCSEQMKKCYILGSRMFVDLYENDRVSLNKTCKQQKIFSSNSCEASINEMKQQFANAKQIKNKNNDFIKQFSSILNLKHQIFQKNVFGTYSFLQKCTNLPRCCCQIFNNESICSEIAEDRRIIDLFYQIKEKRHSKLTILTEIDQQIFSYINEQTCSDLFQLSIPIESFIKMRKQNFVRFLTISHWLVKIFFYINPFESSIIKQVSQKVWTNRKKIIEKIFYCMASKKQIEQSNHYCNFMSLKTQFTLRFFYEETKHLNNLKILISLRLLLIQTMSKFDYQLIQRIEQQILQLTEDKDSLILRIINFYLFWKLNNSPFDFENVELDKWIQKFVNKNSSQKVDYSSNIGILFALVQKDYYRLAQQICSSEQIPIRNIFSDNNNKQLTELKINNFDLLIFEIHEFMKNRVSKISLKSSELIIYINRESSIAISKPNLDTQFFNFQRIFVRFSAEYFRQFLSYSSFKKLTQQRNFDRFPLIFEFLGIQPQLFFIFSTIIRKNANTMLIFFQMILKQWNPPPIFSRNLFCNLCKVSTFLAHIQANLIEKQSETRLSNLEIEYFHSKIKQLLITAKKQCEKSSKKNFFDIKIKSIEIQLILNDKKKRVALTKQFVESIFPFCFNDQSVQKNILAIFTDFKREIEEVDSYCFEGFYFRDAFEVFADNLIEKYGGLVFDFGKDLLGMIVKVKFRKNKFEEAFHCLELASLALQCKNRNTTIPVLVAFYNFFKEVDFEFIYKKYFELINNKLNAKNCKYLIIHIFMKIKGSLGRSERIQGFKRIVYGVQSIETIEYENFRQQMFEFAINECLHKNEKQRGIYLRKIDKYKLLLYKFIKKDWIKFNEQNIHKIFNKKVRSFLLLKNNLYQLYSCM